MRYTNINVIFTHVNVIYTNIEVIFTLSVQIDMQSVRIENIYKMYIYVILHILILEYGCLCVCVRPCHEKTPTANTLSNG